MIRSIFGPAKSRWRANVQLFIGFGCGMLALRMSAFWNADYPTLGLFCFSLFATGSAFYQGGKTLWDDYKRRLMFFEAQQTTNRTHDGRYATYEEMRDAGMFDGKGRILGMTLEGYLLFEPHRRKPNFSFFHGGQGSFKTTASVFASALIHAIAPRR